MKFTNLDKPLWPDGTTKGDYLEYLATVAPVMVPHLDGRAITLKRYPDGSQSKGFFEKRSPSHRPEWVTTAEVVIEGERATQVVVDRADTLLWLGQLAAIELHAPLARAGHEQHPDHVVFDLDPGEPAELLDCCEIALILRELFTRLGLETFAKTSGGKGLQLYLPVERGAHDVAECRGFAEQVAQSIAAAHADKVVAHQRRSDRRGKVLIDWYQNLAGRTTIAAYSARARETASISAPVAWDEIEQAVAGRDADSLRQDIRSMPARIEELGDLFAPVLAAGRRLPAL